MKKWKIICLVMVGAVFLGFYSRSPHPQPGSGVSADHGCKALLAEKENHEALSWIEQSKPGDIRTLGEQSPQESLALVKNLYDSGAVKAHVIGIERAAGYGETTNIVCVELPTTASSRKRLFKIESDLAARGGFDPVPDEGQTYLFLYKFKRSFGQFVRQLLRHNS